MKCPRCEVNLLPAEHRGEEIDICPQCKGIWLDSGELEKINEILETLAETDELTQLKNRRYFIKAAIKEAERAKRYQHSCAILMIDIDNFKNVNDKFGHTVGDEVLKKLADILLHSTRTTDTVCRYGGEEFIVLLPETNIDNAYITAEKIRLQVDNTIVKIDNKVIPVTISIGVAAMFYFDSLKVVDIIERSDKALYLAKHSGRNNTKVYS
ncbi:MAG: diguanylate cyclase [Cyanobacteriota bacterium]